MKTVLQKIASTRECSRAPTSGNKYKKKHFFGTPCTTTCKMESVSTYTKGYSNAPSCRYRPTGHPIDVSAIGYLLCVTLAFCISDDAFICTFVTYHYQIVALYLVFAIFPLIVAVIPKSIFLTKVSDSLPMRNIPHTCKMLHLYDCAQCY